MTFEQIRQNLIKGGSLADAAIIEALKQFPEIRVKAGNDYGDGAIEGFGMNKETEHPYISFYSLGDGTDRTGSERLGQLQSRIGIRDRYDFSWREERLRYTHTVTTSFDRKCLDEAYRQAAEWLSDENIAKRARHERMHPMFLESWKLVIKPMGDRDYCNTPFNDGSEKWHNAYQALNAAIETYLEELEKMTEDAWSRTLSDIFKRNYKRDRDIPKNNFGQAQYDINLVS